MVKRIERVDLLDMDSAVLDWLNLGSELERPAGGGRVGQPVGLLPLLDDTLGEASSRSSLAICRPIALASSTHCSWWRR